MATDSVEDGNDEGGLKNHHPASQHSKTVTQVEEFFKYKPPRLYPAIGHTTSDKTPRPGMFDMHLDPSLRPRRVLYLPTIEDDLKEIAEHALQSASDAGTLPPITDQSPDVHTRARRFQNSLFDRILCEAEVEAIYKATAANYCGHLEWTLHGKKPRRVADGYARRFKRSARRLPCLRAMGV